MPSSASNNLDRVVNRIKDTGGSTNEKFWELYFERPEDWWDNMETKRHPRGLDFRHKATRQALWIDSWATPDWVKTRLK